MFSVLVNPGVVSPTLNVDLTLVVIHCKFEGGILDLRCCNDHHLLHDVSSRFQSSMTILHHKNVCKIKSNFVSIIDIWIN
jgi:hypothetical protein